jgi:hypothetical protein
MPHFGLMDEDALGPVEGPLMRAKLHMRCGRRRLLEGKIPEAVITLYDVLSAAMEWYAAVPARRNSLMIMDGEDLRDDRVLYEILRRSGVLDGSFDYDAFDRLTVQALNDERPAYDYGELLKGIEAILTQLGVMPFDESALPPEDPATF